MRQPIEKLAVKPKHLSVILQILAENAPLAEVWAYGSRVNGNGHEGSDLNLVVKGDADLVQLQAAFQNSLLPMLVDIHQWERLPISFHTNIQANYVVLQEKK
ncbi:nucleotidyltransferase family protein [Actinobacillus equuli]|uniref:Nucleotidyltransferase n=1 Tax=Actinobacillus equuli TaxID=718 RepID=A0AAX3FI35_ACTEU|nr:nucleotidyltransferase domain-containing protein [Actinobacillus equuli]AIZ79786.1 DNA polymerase III subunit beta [Actinobacillus equuli subsp. equuli]WGE43897.1 nucleotidyltransferase domain-containing protein [Actinobacillus equuli subsp. equuli]VEE90650.1 nucleotidyltransferase [Actinobacillus equuli]